MIVHKKALLLANINKSWGFVFLIFNKFLGADVCFLDGNLPLFLQIKWGRALLRAPMG